MDQMVQTASMIRCIIWSSTERSVLFFREKVVFKERNQYVESSHWELPKGKLLPGETLAETAARIAYDRHRAFG